MDRILERAAKNMANVSDDEFEEALAEAMQAIRMRASWRVR